MHSTYESTAQAVAVLVPWLQEQGYQLVTVRLETGSISSPVPSRIMMKKPRAMICTLDSFAFLGGAGAAACAGRGDRAGRAA